MKVLVLNCGSSSLKFKLINTSLKRIKADADEELSSGLIEKIGLPGAEVHFYGRNKEYYHEVAEILNHHSALLKAISLLLDDKIGVIKSKRDIEAVGHRVVHGGESFSKSVVIDIEVETEIQKCAKFAPLHNPHNLEGIRVSREVFGDIPNIAAFDTGFHQTLVPKAYTYGIPSYFYYRDGIRKYGFHGLSHRYVMFKVAQVMGVSKEKLKIISCHLGNGASVTAINAGRSADTSMGLTPLEGLVMGSRCGDIDPEVVIYLMAREGLALHEVSSLLNKHSGLLGISGVSNDVRTLLEKIEQHSSESKSCRNAIDVFCYRLKKYISSYIGVLNGADILAFTAGIGECSPFIRSMTCLDMDFLGIKIDEKKNSLATGGILKDISAVDSKIKVFVVPTDEELIIARDTVRILKKSTLPGQ